jgi:hypothetical protein
MAGLELVHRSFLGACVSRIKHCASVGAPGPGGALTGNKSLRRAGERRAEKVAVNGVGELGRAHEHGCDHRRPQGAHGLGVVDVGEVPNDICAAATELDQNKTRVRGRRALGRACARRGGCGWSGGRGRRIPNCGSGTTAGGCHEGSHSQCSDPVSGLHVPRGVTGRRGIRYEWRSPRAANWQRCGRPVPRLLIGPP